MMPFPTFFPKTYDDTLAMLVETRFYVANFEIPDQRALTEDRRARASYESMRVTARLAHVMAWLLLQRAVNAGEIALDDLEAFGPGPKQGAGVLCRLHDDGNDWLPQRLQSLLERSISLFRRVERLDLQVRSASTP